MSWHRFYKNPGNAFSIQGLSLSVFFYGQEIPAKIDTGQDFVIIPQAWWRLFEANHSDRSIRTLESYSSCKLRPCIIRRHEINSTLWMCQVSVDEENTEALYFKTIFADLKDGNIILGRELFNYFQLQYRVAFGYPEWSLEFLPTPRPTIAIL